MFVGKSKFKSRFLALTLVLALFLLATGNVTAATLYQQRDTLQKTVTNTTAQSQAQKTQAAQLQKEATALDSQIGVLSGKIAQTNQQIAQSNADIASTATKITTEEQNLATVKKKLGDVLSDWYMKGSPSFSEQMVATGSLSQFIDQAQYFEAIRSQISEQIAKVKDLKLALENTKKEQEKQLADLKTLQNTQSSQKKSLASSQANKTSMAQIAANLSSKYAADAQAASNQLAQVNGDIRQAELAAAARYNDANRNTVTRDGTSTRGFSWPLSNFRYGCPFGYSSCYFTGVFHSGIDLNADPLAPVKAAKGGTVVNVTEGMGNTFPYNKSYGNNVQIQHEGGVVSLYGHLASGTITVSEGDTVQAGQVIGQEGNTGYSTGYHLHFEVRFNGVADNPEYYLP